MRWILITFSALAGMAVTAMAAEPLIHSNFEDGPGAWTAMGETGVIRVSRDAADMREGKPSLALDYEIGQRKFGIAILPVTPPALADMDQIHFWLRTDFATSVAIVLNEKGGGNYTSMVWSPGRVWQEVKLQPRDFALSERGTDPPDPDGKLDLDQVQGIGVVDLAQMFSGVPPDPKVPIVIDQHSGKHTVLISGFEVLGANSTRNSSRDDNLVIDAFDTPQLSWSSPGGVALRIDSSRDHAPGPAMEVSYRPVETSAIFFARNLPPHVPANATHIAFDIASENPAQLIFALQEKGSGRGEGPRYNAIVEVKGGGKPDHRELALSAFNFDPKGPPDPGGELNVAKLKSLAIADISAAANVSNAPNRLWISNLRVVAHE